MTSNYKYYAIKNKANMISPKLLLSIIPIAVLIMSGGIYVSAQVGGFHPIQFEQMPLADQKFVQSLPAFLDEGYSALFLTNGAPLRITDSDNREWLYRITDQAMAHDYTGSNTPEAFCDNTLLPEQQSAICWITVSNGNVSEVGAFGTVIGATKEASETRDAYLAVNQDRYTKFHQGNDPTNLDPTLRHLWATLCEKPNDDRFNMFDMKKYFEWFDNGVAPEYKDNIKNHILTGLAFDADGNPVLLPDGTQQKIHPNGIHLDCPLK